MLRDKDYANRRDMVTPNSVEKSLELFSKAMSFHKYLESVDKTLFFHMGEK
jgi:hypothetical protein